MNFKMVEEVHLIYLLIDTKQMKDIYHLEKNKEVEMLIQQ